MPEGQGTWRQPGWAPIFDAVFGTSSSAQVVSPRRIAGRCLRYGLGSSSSRSHLPLRSGAGSRSSAGATRSGLDLSDIGFHAYS